jgi:hypothetical protein
MPVVAIAFHNAVAPDKLNDLFSSDEVVSRSQTKSINSPKCGLFFAVVVTQKDDTRNDLFVEGLRIVIGDDCDNGIHNEEYAYEAPPEAPN